MLTPINPPSEPALTSRARIQALWSTFDARTLRRGLFSTLPRTITISTSAGKSRTSGGYLPPSADQSDSHSASESAVQNDHSTQMNQKVAKVFSVTRPRLLQVCCVL